jgi:hypothetical protein
MPFSVIRWRIHSNRSTEIRYRASLDRDCDGIVNTHRVYLETPTDATDERQKYYEYLTLLLARFDSLDRTRKINIDTYSLQILDCAKWLHDIIKRDYQADAVCPAGWIETNTSARLHYVKTIPSGALLKKTTGN